jgi:uncharacterized protein YjbI with pentapeptide repeats
VSSKKKQRASIEIFDATGEVVYRAFVEDPELGLKGAVLEGLTAPLAQMQGLNLSGARLYWASLGGADLSFANLSGADLRGATLDGAVCRQTNFRDANLGRDNLNGRTSLKGADLTGAMLEGAMLNDVVYDDMTKFPVGFEPEGHGLTHVKNLSADDSRRK